MDANPARTGKPAEPPRPPDRNDEYLLYQVLVGTGPATVGARDARGCKAARISPNASGDDEIDARGARAHQLGVSHRGIRGRHDEPHDTALSGNRASAFLAAFLPFARRVAAPGAHNSWLIGREARRPGVPDLYNGTELWDLSLVDPDNRAPIDFALRERLLQETRAGLEKDRAGSMRGWLADWHAGHIKLATTLTLLQYRREQPKLFAAGSYQAPHRHGQRRQMTYAPSRARTTAVPWFVPWRASRGGARRGFGAQTRVTMPSSPALSSGLWQDLLSGREFRETAHALDAGELFELLPAVVLVAPGTGRSAGRTDTSAGKFWFSLFASSMASGSSSSAARFQRMKAPQAASRAAVASNMEAAAGSCAGLLLCTPRNVATRPSMARATMSTTRNRDKKRRTRVGPLT